MNRCIGPVMAEAMAVVKEGASLEQIDRAMLKFGWPVGSIALADEVGIDISYNVNKFLTPHLGSRMAGGDVSMLEQMVEKNFLGKSKGGLGYYEYRNGKKVGVNPEVTKMLETFQPKGVEMSDLEVAERITFKFVNEAALCLQEGIIDSARDGNLASIFGIGFPPFRGGPFMYLNEFGIDKFVDRMHTYENTLAHGEAFKPAPILVDYAKTGKKFEY